ncbi:MAG: nucleotidyltransferase domain-containing protein [Betaproteobacteria bacterium]|nr:nucleotidyltransferase domain-containing protein [Betaproteobacteria bacterium]
MLPDLEIKLPEIREICRRYPVAKLSAFGSAVTGGFERDKSDIDFLLTLSAESPAQYTDAYFAILDELERLSKVPVDLVTDQSLTNSIIRANIEKTAVPLYGPR